MIAFLWVCLGSALGGGCRYTLSTYMAPRIDGFPWAVMSINLLGSLLIGILAAVFSKHAPSESLNLFLVTGILGGFTTFSTFSLEAMQLLRQEAWAAAVFYVAASVLLGISLCIAGYFLTLRLMP